MVTIKPYIPENITVHLGPPSEDGPDVTLPFAEYIKNVASSEIYPSWSESAIRANIYAQISYALNRVYVEYYRSRGYSFDITNSTAIDQSFVPGRNIFENIDRIVSEIFDIYIRRELNIEPLAAKYCNGTTVTCQGLSQWGSQELGALGYGSFDILVKYYGNNITLEYDASVEQVKESYPGFLIRKGDKGEYVAVIQTELNRIGENYPLINKITPVDGVFGENTEAAVKTFQGIFNLAVDGIVGKATWYKLINIYVGITKLAELDSEGNRFDRISISFSQGDNITAMAVDSLGKGDRGEEIEILQYLIAVLGAFYYTIPEIDITGVYDDETENAVIQIEKTFRLPVTGRVNKETWSRIYRAYMGIEKTVLRKLGMENEDRFPGFTIKAGDRDE